MRDPLGAIRVGSTHVHRSLYSALAPEHFLHTEAARAMVARAQLVPFEFLSEKEISSPRIAFVSYPHEWCNAQFVDAAELTLALSEAALDSGHELKDGSAWNVIFDGCRPLFCDHLSFQSIADQRWWAFAQYIRHFILPLCLAKYRQMSARASFAISRDGMDPDLGRGLMGWKRFGTRYWLLLLKTSGATVAHKPRARGGDSNHKNLYAMTRWLLDGVRTLRRSKSTWLNYTSERVHYTEQASDVKYRTVQTWLAALAPSWVIDLGCNTGEFSKLAAAGGAKVVAIDLDHESIQALYLSSQGGQQIYPVVANIDDLTGGRGWAGNEFPGLLSRLEQHAEVVMMLALVHHVAISAAIPYQAIAETSAKLSKRYLIVELLDSADPLVQRLAAQRNRAPEEFSIALQRQAFEHYFTTLETIDVPQSARQLFLMEKRENV